MPKNKYVDFVSDAHFIGCVRHVCNAYARVRAQNPNSLFKNNIDPFKMVFDVVNNRMSFGDWVGSERARQNDKTINNAVGEFHQKLLGGVSGWVDLGVGDETKVDLRRQDNSIFMELKNKYNTVNSDSFSKVREKLDKAAREHPKAVAYWAYIINKDGSSGESALSFKGNSNPRIRVVWGKNVYTVVTGDPTSLERTWKALPYAIADVVGGGFRLTAEEASKLSGFFAQALRV